MQCPFCGLEMVEGELRNHGPHYFLPKWNPPPKMATNASIKKVGGIPLPINYYELSIDPKGPKWPVAYWCETCSKILIDCEQ